MLSSAVQWFDIGFALHTARIVHGDLSADNLLFDEDLGRWNLIDFDMVWSVEEISRYPDLFQTNRYFWPMECTFSVPRFIAATMNPSFSASVYVARHFRKWIPELQKYAMQVYKVERRALRAKEWYRRTVAWLRGVQQRNGDTAHLYETLAQQINGCAFMVHLGDMVNTLYEQLLLGNPQYSQLVRWIRSSMAVPVDSQWWFQRQTEFRQLLAIPSTVPRCVQGKRFNRRTRRCAQACPNATDLNTGDCLPLVNVSLVAPKAKECVRDKVYNPITRRCVRSCPANKERTPMFTCEPPMQTIRFPKAALNDSWWI